MSIYRPLFVEVDIPRKCITKGCGSAPSVEDVCPDHSIQITIEKFIKMLEMSTRR